MWPAIRCISQAKSGNAQPRQCAWLAASQSSPWAWSAPPRSIQAKQEKQPATVIGNGDQALWALALRRPTRDGHSRRVSPQGSGTTLTPTVSV